MIDLKSDRKIWKAHKKEARAHDHKNDVVLGISASFTAEPVEPYLGASLLGHGYEHPAIHFADYAQIMQMCFDWTSHFPAETSDILIAWQIEDIIGYKLNAEDPAEVVNAAAQTAEELVSGVKHLRESFEGAILVTIPPQPKDMQHDMLQFGQIPLSQVIWNRVFGIIQDGLAGTQNLRFVDTASLITQLGHVEAYDERKRLLFRQPFAEMAFAHIGHLVARTIRAQRLEAKKCIVLDCDNTLWGGVIGEDGLGGIKIGQDFPGRAFTEFQHICKTLKNSGVLLAVCSKNNFDDAHTAFVNHDEMVLREKDIAVFKINWDLKSQNIRQIAEELNIGTSSIVFVDDSNYEISEVNNALPEVTTVQVPEDVGDFPTYFKSFLPLFDRLEITDDDKQRADRIRQEAGRKSSAKSLSREDFLKTLELKLEYFNPTEDDLERTTQLVNKTNQFNMTTKRMTFQETQSYANDDDKIVRCIRVGDRFGDYGLVGVIVAKIDGETAYIENLLMSCRVLGRGIETGFIASFLQELGEKGVCRIAGAYIPSPKNQQVELLLDRNGFKRATDIDTEKFGSDDAQIWAASPDDRLEVAEFLTVIKTL